MSGEECVKAMCASCPFIGGTWPYHIKPNTESPIVCVEKTSIQCKGAVDFKREHGDPSFFER